MRLGLIARYDKTGLGHQTWEFYRHMRPDKTLVVDLTRINSQYGKETDQHPEWYPDAQIVPFPLSPNAIDEFLKDLDVVFTVESPYNDYLYDSAKRHGVKVALQYNWEFLDLLQDDTYKPDILLAPTKWNYGKAQRMAKSKWKLPIKYLPVPVATDRFKPSVKKSFTRFLHVAGHPTHGDRNGTGIVKSVKGRVDVDITIRKYSPDCEYWEMFDGYDVLVIPRRYGGLSLQIQEAMAGGLAVIVGEHDPYAKSCITARSYRGEYLNIRRGSLLETHNVSENDLAYLLSSVTDKPNSVAETISQNSIRWSIDNSWERMRPTYLKTLRSLCE